MRIQSLKTWFIKHKYNMSQNLFEFRGTSKNDDNVISPPFWGIKSQLYQKLSYYKTARK